jgi:hypothetical protein
MWGLVPDQLPQPRPQCVRQRLRERREQHPRIRVRPSQMHRSVERHDRLPRAGRPGHARRPAVPALHRLALRRMQEDRPLVPRVLERPLQLLAARHRAEPPPRVRMLERVRIRHMRIGSLRLGHHLALSARILRRELLERARLVGGRIRQPRKRSPRSQHQQRLGRFRRKVIREIEKVVLRRPPNLLQPLRGHSTREQIVHRRIGKQRPLRSRRLHVPRKHHLLHALPNLHPLRGTRLRMRLQPTALRPAISRVVMVRVAQQQASLRPVDDQPNVAADPHRPEVLVLRLLELVELHARGRRVDLEVERRRLDGLLLVARESGQAVGEGVGDAEVHYGFRRLKRTFPHAQRMS